MADTGQYLDLFSAVSYSNSDGTEAWTTNWVESEGTGPATGFMKITSGALRVIADAVNDNIYREVDLSNAVVSESVFHLHEHLECFGFVHGPDFGQWWRRAIQRSTTIRQLHEHGIGLSVVST